MDKTLNKIESLCKSAIEEYEELCKVCDSASIGPLLLLGMKDFASDILEIIKTGVDHD